MKQIYTLAFTLFIVVNTLQARPLNTVIVTTGNWSANSSWSLNRLPEDGDSVVIPVGKTIIFDKNTSLGNVVIYVMGTLQMNKKMKLDELSYISVSETGQIKAKGSNRKNETIELDGKMKFDENDAVAITGPSYTNNKTGVAPAGFVYGMTLPVKFVSFYASSQNNSIQLTWATAEEKDNSHFEVERSFDGRNWKSIAIIFGKGNSTQVNRYTYTDKSPNASVIYYRIRQVDMNGTAVNSTVKVISETKTSSSVSIYAGAGKNVVINMNTEARDHMQVTVLNINGQVVNRQMIARAAYQVILPMNNVPAGLYVIQVSDKSGWSEVKKVVL